MWSYPCLVGEVGETAGFDGWGDDVPENFGAPWTMGRHFAKSRSMRYFEMISNSVPLKLLVGLLVGLVVVGLAVWRISARVYAKPASDSLHQKIKAYLAVNTELQPAYVRAMSDCKLTLGEAQAIMDEGKALRQQGKAEAPPEIEE